MDAEPPRLAINIPDEFKRGAYSDVVMVWHNQFGFTLDFLAQLQPELVAAADGDPALPFEVVARVRIPPSVIFLLMKALNENLTRYEQTFGPIPDPGQQKGQP
jgi:hypothetical protein